MAGYRCLITLLLCAVVCACYAQQSHDMSKPLAIKQKGWNKVLCMKNGNTMLFHFEPAKAVIVKVFDSTHKEIASRKHGFNIFGKRKSFSILDFLMMERMELKGVYDIDGEAVLFFDQDSHSKHQLVRLRFNGVTGALINEALVGESQSENKRIKYYVMKNKDNDNYEILFCMDKKHPRRSDIYMVYFNSKHESIREVQLNVDRKKYDYLDVIDAESQPNGVMVILGLDKTVLNGRPDEFTPLVQGGALYDHYLSYYYIPEGDSVPVNRVINLSVGVFPFYGLYTYNDYAKTISSLLYSYKPTYYKFGINEITGSISQDLYFMVHPLDLSMIVNPLPYIDTTKATEALTTNNAANNIPIKMFTNKNGLTTLVSQTVKPFVNLETSARVAHEDYFGNISIMQLDDLGDEIWRTVLPFSQYYNSYQHNYDIKRLAKGWQGQMIFGDFAPKVYERQFLSFNCYTYNRNFYIVYNGNDRDFRKKINERCDTIYNYSTTNACYYKMDAKKNIVRQYLFGEPKAKEYRCSFIEGADFDEKRGVYASLIQYKKGGDISLRMAWSRLE